MRVFPTTVTNTVTPKSAAQAVPPPAPPKSAPVAPAPAGLLSTWKLFAHALVSGQNVHVPGALPPFPTLDPTQLARAQAAGRGRTVAQPLLSPDAASTSFHDPVNFVIRGSKDDLVKALEGQGWSLSASRSPWNFIKMGLSVLFHLGHDPGAPVSAQYLNGQVETMAFNKNVDYNRGRDHLRVFSLGKDPKTGQDMWAVAAVRDDALSITFPHPDTHGKIWPWEWTWHKPMLSHASDSDIDGERDLVMQDLLRSGLVQNWAAVDGKPPAVAQKTPLGDGRYKLLNRYPTDGQVYEVNLGGKPGA
ncbi:MAG TPA: LssY C-terminal domain-containing protein [Oscillatoriaceae cyanobacterium]